MIKTAIVSLGCSKNLVDSEIMAGLLSAADMELVTDEESAEVIIVNTCAFIDDAKTEAINTILEMAQYKKTGSLKKLIVTGCLAERYKDEVLKEMPEVDAIVGVSRFDEIVSVILSDKKIFLGNENAAYPEGVPRIAATPFYSVYLKIAEGCDNCCTYCAIPMIRGRSRSRKMEDILAEAQHLADDGALEINVIAQDTSRYGEDVYGKSMLPELLTRLCTIEGPRWIRVLYMYPERISDELLEVFAQNKKIAPYFDIPIQHISDSVLKRMGRKCTSEQIKAVVKKIRTRLPGAVIRTTLMTGFPGESDEDFGELYAFVKEAEFDRLGVFAYSREEGTPADRLDGHMDEEIKKCRRDKIMQLQSEISRRLCEKYVGQTLEVLAEAKIGEQFVGRTVFDAPEIDGQVLFAAEGEGILGELVKVRIISADNYDLTGVCVE